MTSAGEYARAFAQGTLSREGKGRAGYALGYALSSSAGQVEREAIVLSAIAREIQFHALPGSGQSRGISGTIHQARSYKQSRDESYRNRPKTLFPASIQRPRVDFIVLDLGRR